jgi:ABC-2 type transport system permease protein
VNFIRLIIWKEFTQIRSDPLIIRLIIFPVVLQMFVLGYAITTEVKNTALTVLDRSNTPESASLVQTIVHNRLFKFTGYAVSEADCRLRLDKGESRLALIVPAGFAKDLETPQGAEVSLIIDGQDANSSTISSGYITSIISGWSVSFLKEKLARRGLRIKNILPVEVRPVILFNPMLKSTWYMVPALAVVLVTMITALLTGFSIVKEKEAGTLEQLMVTPIGPVHVVLGKIVPYVVIGLFELCAVLAAATLWFGVPFKGNFFTLLLFGLIYMTSSIGIGILISTIARNAQQVLFMLWFILIFFLFLSGFFLALENMPLWVQKITVINPLRYFMFILREMFLKGSGFAELWRQGLSMLVIGAAVFGASLITFQRKVS